VVAVAARFRDVGRAGEDTEAVGAARSRSDSRDPFAGVESALITRYLLGLGALCFEVSRNPRLLPTFIAIIARVPSTIIELAGYRRRIAA
jgi:hypothetical protein